MPSISLEFSICSFRTSSFRFDSLFRVLRLLIKTFGNWPVPEIGTSNLNTSVSVKKCFQEMLRTDLFAKYNTSSFSPI